MPRVGDLSTQAAAEEADQTKFALYSAALSVCIAVALVSLEAKAEGSRHCIRIIVVSRELAVVANGDSHPWIELELCTGIYYQAIVSDRGSMEGRGGSS